MHPSARQPQSRAGETEPAPEVEASVEAPAFGAQALLALQQSAGNVAVQRILRATSSPPPLSPSPGRVLQRAGWFKASFPTPAASLAYHWGKHGKPFGKTKQEYTADAEAHYAANSAKGVATTLSDGSKGLKIKGAPGGIYTAAGEIVSFWYD
jgi:hypothetical protein